ncbi:MAG: hypothetical protein MMC33_003689 [Icmadophila ericetorum]|nr:hypothetical protein [Icmadophila ericetorum]
MVTKHMPFLDHIATHPSTSLSFSSTDNTKTMLRVSVAIFRRSPLYCHIHSNKESRRGKKSTWQLLVLKRTLKTGDASGDAAAAACYELPSSQILELLGETQR